MKEKKPLCFISKEDSEWKIMLKKIYSNHYEKYEKEEHPELNDVYLVMSTDGRAWNNMSVNTEYKISGKNPLMIKAGEIREGRFVPLRNSQFGNEYIWHTFHIESTSKIDIEGSISSLLSSDYIEENGTWQFRNLFEDCENIENASKLELLSKNTPECYFGMFVDCTRLTEAPELPAVELADSCYSHMFEGCTGLKEAPELPAFKLKKYCYCGMFSGCTGLNAAPELPAVELADVCYCEMFLGCTGLTSAPVLPAVELSWACYYRMFEDCTGLKEVPELPAVELTESCYAHMFDSCSNLKYIKMLAEDISASQCLYKWVEGVSQNGTFVKNASATWDKNGNSGIPKGWTVETE